MSKPTKPHDVVAFVGVLDSLADVDAKFEDLLKTLKNGVIGSVCC